MKQTIEVEVGPEDDAGTCLVVLGGTRHERWDRNRVLDLGLTIPESEPERTEYRLDYLDHGNGRITGADEVLVAAHSLRVGDRVEWAPGDWREITQMEDHRLEWAPGDWREITQVEDHRLAITLWFDDEPFTLNRWALVAVRR